MSKLLSCKFNINTACAGIEMLVQAVAFCRLCSIICNTVPVRTTVHNIFRLHLLRERRASPAELPHPHETRQFHHRIYRKTNDG